MIKPSLQYLAKELNRELNNNAEDSMYVLENVARIDLDSNAASSGNQNKVMLTLVNIEEERALKNEPFYIRRYDPQRGEVIEKRNPTLYINLYLLFSCTDTYVNALDRIYQVIEYFQGKYIFTEDTANTGDQYPHMIEKIILDLYSLNFEQLNHLWGMLGGKYVPSVLYRLRLLPVQRDVTSPATPIEEIKIDTNPGS